jgi:hypothetical protein
MGWATFWALYSQAHLVTLIVVSVYQNLQAMRIQALGLCEANLKSKKVNHFFHSFFPNFLLPSKFPSCRTFFNNLRQLANRRDTHLNFLWIAKQHSS